MTETLSNVDGSLLLFFNSMHNAFFDRFFEMATGRFIWIPFYAALLAVLIKTCGLRRSLIYIAGIALTITLADQICATLLRPAIARMRPSNPDNPISALVHVVNGYRGGRYGFPSCHGANTFALEMFLCPLMRSRRFTATLVIWAVLNCYSRMYLGVHYPGDLLAGALIGGATGYAVYLLSSRVSRRFAAPESGHVRPVSGRWADCVPAAFAVMVVAIAVTAACQASQFS